MLLEQYFNEAKKIQLLNKYSNYSAFEDFIFDLNNLSKNFNGFYRTIILSGIEPAPKSMVYFWEDTVYPTYFLKNTSPKAQFEFVFFLLKSQGLIKNFQFPIQLLEHLKNNKEINSFFEFLCKSGYSHNTNNCSLKQVIINYKKEFDAIIENVSNNEKEANYSHALEILHTNFKEYSDSDVFKSKINTCGNKYFEALAIKTNTLTISNHPELELLYKQSTQFAELLNDDLGIKTILKVLKAKIAELDREKNTLNDYVGFLEAANNKLIKQPLATYCDNLEDDIIKNSPNAYFKELAIGKVEIENHSWPITFPFFDSNGCYLNSDIENCNDILQNIVLRIIFSLPKGHAKVKIVDENFGSTFSMLLGLSHEIIGDKVLYDEKDLLKLHDELKLRDSQIIFNKLKNAYPDILSYNFVNEVDFEPIELIIINNFPHNFSVDLLDYISKSLQKKSRTGVYFIISLAKDFSELDPKHIQLLDDIKSKLFDLNQNLSTLLPKIDETIRKHIQITLNSKLSAEDYTVNKFSELYSLQDSHIDADSGHETANLISDTIKGISIPIGKSTKLGDINLDIGNSSGSYHGIICGTTGSGKTVLLHQIICGGVKKYTADELQFLLLDFKEGTGFQVYKNLPHARVLGIDADVDFGFETLKFLNDTMKERATMFKKNGCKDLTEYRNKTNNKCPRLLIIIDEFQVLLSNTNLGGDRDQINNYLENIVRLGRSFGIHLLLSTQTPSGVKWNASTMENIGIRIGLRMSSEAENSIFSHRSGIASKFTEKYGKAVYNDKAGVESESKVFNVVNIDEDKIPLIVEEAVIDAKKSNTLLTQRTIYIANTLIPYSGMEIGKSNWSTSNKSFNAYLGNAANISHDAVNYKFEDNANQNMLIVGANVKAKNDIIAIIMNDFIANSLDGSNVSYYSEVEKNQNAHYNTFKDVSRFNFLESKEDLLNEILNCKKTLDQKLFPNNGGIRKLLIIDGMKKLFDFHAINYDPTDFSADVKSVLSEIFQSAPNINLTIIVYSAEKGKIENILGHKSVDFEYAVSLSGVNNKIKNDMYDSYDIPDNMGILYQRSLDLETKFNLITL